jgi:hypothetical protein
MMRHAVRIKLNNISLLSTSEKIIQPPTVQVKIVDEKLGGNLTSLSSVCF